MSSSKKAHDPLKEVSNMIRALAFRVFHDRAIKAGAVSVYSRTDDQKVELAAVFAKYEDCAKFASQEFVGMHAGLDFAGTAFGKLGLAISSSICVT